MRYLFDTCAFYWFANGQKDKLSPAALATIGNSGDEGSVSVLSFWELAMKASVGKLAFPGGSVSILAGLCEREGIRVLPLTVEFVDQFLLLPPVHADPFDRLLAAISLHRNEAGGSMAILSPDDAFDAYKPYGVVRIW